MGGRFGKWRQATERAINMVRALPSEIGARACSGLSWVALFAAGFGVWAGPFSGSWADGAGCAASAWCAWHWGEQWRPRLRSKDLRSDDEAIGEALILCAILGPALILVLDLAAWAARLSQGESSSGWWLSAFAPGARAWLDVHAERLRARAQALRAGGPAQAALDAAVAWTGLLGTASRKDPAKVRLPKIRDALSAGADPWLPGPGGASAASRWVWDGDGAALRLAAALGKMAPDEVSMNAAAALWARSPNAGLVELAALAEMGLNPSGAKGGWLAGQALAAGAEWSLCPSERERVRAGRFKAEMFGAGAEARIGLALRKGLGLLDWGADFGEDLAAVSASRGWGPSEEAAFLGLDWTTWAEALARARPDEASKAAAEAVGPWVWGELGAGVLGPWEREAERRALTEACGGRLGRPTLAPAKIEPWEAFVFWASKQDSTAPWRDMPAPWTFEGSEPKRAREAAL